MKLVIFEYQCEPCGHVFHAPGLPETSYGEFLLRDEAGGSLAYLNAISDPTYDEVDTLLGQISGVDQITPNKRAEILRMIYGAVACDPSADGVPLIIGQHPRCPTCQSIMMRSWHESNPLDVVDIDVPAVTHLFWHSLEENEKIIRIEKFIVNKIR